MFGFLHITDVGNGDVHYVPLSEILRIEAGSGKIPSLTPTRILTRTGKAYNVNMPANAVAAAIIDAHTAANGHHVESVS